MHTTSTSPDVVHGPSMTPQVQFKALNELQAPAQSGDQLQWITSSAHVLNVSRHLGSLPPASCTHLPKRSMVSPSCLHHRPVPAYMMASRDSTNGRLESLTLRFVSVRLLPVQITAPSGHGFMMGVTPQIMSRAVLDPMVLYLDSQVGG
jgi:hypothetical protein